MRKCFLILIGLPLFIFSIFIDCKLPDLHNPCDVKSSEFWKTLIVKVGISDRTLHCGVSAFPTVTPVEPLYPGRGRWLDYIKNDGNDYYSASNTTCDGSETGGYSACIHAGEMRSVKILFGSLSPNSCEGFTASDSENAFQYGCYLLPTGGIRITSTSLNKGKRFGDLIDGNTLTFKPIQIFVFQNGILIGKTEKSIWWTNPIKRLPTGGGSLDIPYDIYYSGTNASVGKITVNASNVAIAQSSSSILNVNGANTHLYLVNGKFSYIEGRIDSTASIAVIQIAANAHFAYVREVSISGSVGALIWSVGSYGMYKNLKLFGFNSASDAIRIGDAGVTTQGSTYQTVIAGQLDGYSINAYSNGSGTKYLNLHFSDVLVYSGSSAEAVLLGNAGSGITEGILIRELTLAHSSIGGLIHQASSSQPLRRITDINISLVNNADPAFNLFASTAQDFDLKLLNFASLSGNLVISSVNLSYFTGNFKISSGVSCSVTGGINFGLLNSTCQKNGLSDFTFSNNSSYDQSYIGPIVADDTNNAYDTNGYFPTAIPTAINFFDSMENAYRTWGVSDVTNTLTTAMRGNCAGPCRIYDWSLKKSDVILRNANPCPDPGNPLTHTVSGNGTSDAECNSLVRGAKWTSGNVCVITHLRNAVEILGDGIGNDNLFCESSEDCFYTPNLSAYQGHGNRVKASTLSPNFCPDISTGKTIEKVRLFQFETNGY